MSSWLIIFGLGLISLMATLIIGIGLWVRKPERGSRLALRLIDAFDDLPQKAGEAVESGTRIHISLGTGVIGTQTTTGALAGLTVLDTVAEAATISDKPPVITTSDGGAALLAQNSLRRAYRKHNAIERYDPLTSRMAGPTPLSYIAGAMATLEDEMVSTSLVIGALGPEVALLADAGRSREALQIIGTDNIQGQAAAYVAADDALIGEDMYASGAYLAGGKPFHRASLHAQDVARLLIILAIPVGFLIKLILG